MNIGHQTNADSISFMFELESYIYSYLGANILP